jgi:hypothetical protein
VQPSSDAILGGYFGLAGKARNGPLEGKLIGPVTDVREGEGGKVYRNDLLVTPGRGREVEKLPEIT